MSAARYSDISPDAIDTRFVLRLYAWVTIATGLLLYLWMELFFPSLRTTPPDLGGIAFGRSGLLRTVTAAITALGFIAVGLSRIEHPVSRGRALHWFAVAHLTFGAMFFLQWFAIFDGVIPRAVAWTPLVAGVVLLFISATFARAPRWPHREHHAVFEPDHGPVLVDRGRSINTLRAQYDAHIRQAARLEERTRLARDLHDAVKQQLFAIQTCAATAQARLSSDAPAAHTAIDQVRQSARDAVTEMNALIEQLQTPPVENIGLIAALRHQCEALELRTGARVTLTAGAVPPTQALPPGAQEALYRAAQEALSNVARHARASEVSVTVGLAGDRLGMTVHDNGAGFDPLQDRTGMGVDNMKARVCDLSGTFLLRTAPGRGTSVSFSVPCDIRTSRDYMIRALAWVGIIVLMLVSFSFGRSWERPWNAIVAAIAAVSVARYVAAWHRMRGRTETAA